MSYQLHVSDEVGMNTQVVMTCPVSGYGQLLHALKVVLDGHWRDQVGKDV
jgi:hypothetical protein